MGVVGGFQKALSDRPFDRGLAGRRGGEDRETSGSVSDGGSWASKKRGDGSDFDDGSTRVEAR
jgi:hypothetical protein